MFDEDKYFIKHKIVHDIWTMIKFVLLILFVAGAIGFGVRFYYFTRGDSHVCETPKEGSEAQKSYRHS
jgi:hypothetical protein